LEHLAQEEKLDYLVLMETQDPVEVPDLEDILEIRGLWEIQGVLEVLGPEVQKAAREGQDCKGNVAKMVNWEREELLEIQDQTGPPVPKDKVDHLVQKDREESRVYKEAKDLQVLLVYGVRPVG